MKKLLVTFVFIVAALGAAAQLLWEIRKDGALPSYLLGTCHYVDVDYVDSIPGLDYAFPGCDTLYTEIGLPDISEVQSVMSDYGMKLGKIPPLGTQLSEATAVALREYIISVEGGDSSLIDNDIRRMNMFHFIKKYPSTSVLSSAQNNVQVEIAMDLGLAQIAALCGKVNKALESLEYQYDTYCSFIAENMELYIRDMIEGNFEAERIRIVDNYKKGNLDKLYGEIELYKGLPYMEELINVRNRAWADRLAPSLDRGGVLIAVGAGHLPGDSGLIALFRERGFTVEPAGVPQ